MGIIQRLSRFDEKMDLSRKWRARANVGHVRVRFSLRNRPDQHGRGRGLLLIYLDEMVCKPSRERPVDTVATQNRDIWEDMAHVI